MHRDTPTQCVCCRRQAHFVIHSKREDEPVCEDHFESELENRPGFRFYRLPEHEVPSNFTAEPVTDEDRAERLATRRAKAAHMRKALAVARAQRVLDRMKTAGQTIH